MIWTDNPRFFLSKVLGLPTALSYQYSCKSFVVCFDNKRPKKLPMHCNPLPPFCLLPFPAPRASHSGDTATGGHSVGLFCCRTCSPWWRWIQSFFHRNQTASLDTRIKRHTMWLYTFFVCGWIVEKNKKIAVASVTVWRSIIVSL